MFSTQPFASQSQAPFGDNQPAAEKKPRQEEKQTVLPTTVRAVETSVANRKGDADLEMFGSTPSLLVLMGAVESPDIQTSSATFMLNDSTGRLSVRCFAGDGMAESINQSVKAGHYVVATGMVRFSPELHFTAIQLRAVSSGDEIAYHMIESAHAALKLRAAPPAAELPMPVKTAAAAASPPPASAPAAAPASVPSAATSGLSSEKLLSYLTSLSEEKPEGVSSAAIQAHFADVKDTELKKLLDGLVSSGDAFTTIDDDHFSAV